MGRSESWRRVQEASLNENIENPFNGSCPCRLRINLPDSPVTRRRGKKAYERGLSWPPSGPLSPGDALATSRVNASHPLRSPPVVVSHHHGVLIPPLAGATAARGTGAPHGGSRHGRSAPPPWPASGTATAWPRRGRGWAREAVRAGGSCYEASRSCRSSGTKTADGTSRPHPCITYFPAARPRPPGGGCRG